MGREREGGEGVRDGKVEGGFPFQLTRFNEHTWSLTHANATCRFRNQNQMDANGC